MQYIIKNLCTYNHTLNFADRTVNKKIDALHQHWHKTAFFRFCDYKQIFDLKAKKIRNSQSKCTNYTESGRTVDVPE